MIIRHLYVQLGETTMYVTHNEPLSRRRILVPLVLTCCIWNSTLLAQREDPRTISLPVSTNDRDEISVLLTRLEQGIRIGSKLQIVSALSPMQHRTGQSEQKIDRHLFRISPIQIQIRDDRAIATCSLSDSKKFLVDSAEIVFRKAFGKWKIEKADRISEILPLLESSSEIEPPTPMYPVSVVNTPNILVSVRHSGTPTEDNIFLINRTVTRNYFQLDLFGTTAILGLDYIWYYGDGYEVAFIVDNYWNRLIYGRQHPQDTYLKSYGDHVGDYPLHGSTAITIDPFDTIFIANAFNGTIAKLFFNRSIKTVQFVSEMTVPQLNHPVDVAYDEGNTPCSPNDGDAIWIADDVDGKILKVNRSGGIEYVIENYIYNGTTYRLRPKKVISSPWGWVYNAQMVGVIDKNRNAFVTFDANSYTAGTVTAIQSTEFSPTSSELTCIGMDRFGQFWVGDCQLNMYHTFADNGTYLASIGNGLFQSPHGVSRALVRITPGCSNYYTGLGIGTSDLWSPSDGLRFFYPGADAVNLSATKVGNDFRFRWTTTNRSNTVAEILNVATLASRAELADTYTEYRPASQLPYGVQRLRVTVTPYYNSLYGGYATQPVVREITFYNYPDLSAPTNLTANSQPGNVVLSWSPVANAQGYNIYRNNQLVGTTTATTFWDNVTSAGQSYSYYVKAKYDTYESPASQTVTGSATHLVSDNGNATLSSSQRHIVFGAPAGEALLPLYAGYQTNDRIFLTYSTNLGTTWSSEKYLGEGSYVSLVPDVLGGTGGTEGLVWETPPVDGARNIGFVAWQPYLGTFSRYATIATGIPLSVASHPVVSFFQGYICAVWADQDGLKFRASPFNPPAWGPVAEIPGSSAGDRTPSLSLSPAQYLVYINDWAVYLRRLIVASGSPPQLQWTIPSMVRGSDEMNAVVAQVQGEDFTFNNQYYHRAHVVWQAPVDETANIISYQRFTQSGSVTSGSWLTAVSSWQGDGFKNPSVSVFADGKISIMWSSAQYLFRVDQIVNGEWSPVAVVGPGTNVTLAAGYARPSIENQRHLYVHGTAPLYNIRVGPTPWVPPPIDEEQQTDMIATWQEEQEGETLELKLEEPAYGFGTIDFNSIGDTTWYNTLEEAMNAFETQEFVVGAGAGPLSSGDSISLGGSISLRSHAPTNSASKSGNEEGGLSSTMKNCRLAFDVLDAATRERLRTLAEVKFSQNGTVKIKQRGSLAGLNGRRVFIRPRLIGFPDQLADFSATIKRIHIVSIEPSPNTPSSPTITSKGTALPLPLEYALHPSHPNPFNPATTITFDLPEPSTVSLALYDMLGRVVAELVNGHKEAGYHSVVWSAAGNASGVYFARFTATDGSGKVKFRDVIKLLLTK